MRKILSAATAIAVLTSFTGCSRQENKQESSVTISDTSIHTDSPSIPENKESVVLTYAVDNKPSKEEQAVIDKFNETDNGYIVEVRDYSDFFAEKTPDGYIVPTDDEMRSFSINLTHDLKNGEIDIIRDYYLGNLNIDLLGERGYLTDLYRFLNSDSDVNTAMLNEHVLKLHETDGHLYTLPTMFRIETMAGQTRYVGEKENWTIDELISQWNKMPEGSKISGSNEKNYVYYTILRNSNSSYVDYINGKVSFDSPEFRKALEFCNTFDTPLTYKDDYDYNAVNFVGEKYIWGFNDFHGDVLYNPENQPVTLVGYAEIGGFINTLGSRFSISSLCSEEKQNGAWEFIKEFVMEDYQNDYCYVKEIKNNETIYISQNGFPINTKVYNEFAENAVNGVYGDVILIGDEMNSVGSITNDELERLNKYINSISNLKTKIDDDLDKIIQEEIMSYFNNEKSIDETISNIQNRAEIMVSEKQ